MNKHELQDRTRSFAVRVFKLVERFPSSQGSKIIGGQLIRSASSVGANYRAVNRAKSKADFINKLKIVLEEADESEYWLSFAKEVGILPSNDEELLSLINEADQIVAMFSKSVKTISTKPMEAL